MRSRCNSSVPSSFQRKTHLASILTHKSIGDPHWTNLIHLDKIGGKLVDSDNNYPSGGSSYFFDLDNSSIGCNFEDIQILGRLKEYFPDNILDSAHTLYILGACFGRIDAKKHIVVVSFVVVVDMFVELVFFECKLELVEVDFDLQNYSLAEVNFFVQEQHSYWEGSPYWDVNYHY